MAGLWRHVAADLRRIGVACGDALQWHAQPGDHNVRIGRRRRRKQLLFRHRHRIVFTVNSLAWNLMFNLTIYY